MAATGTEYVTLNQAKLLKEAGDEAIADAIAAEAAARTKADNLLQQGIDAKMQVSDLVAGDNVTITPDSESGHVTISADVPDTSAFVTRTDADAAYAAKAHTHTVSQITDFPEIPEAYEMATDAEASGLLGY